jgi:hypothetical protein
MTVLQTPKRRDRTWLWSLGLSLLIAGLGTAWVLRPVPKLIEFHAYTTQPDDLSSLADLSTYVVEGEVTRVLPGQWTTPDQRRPADLSKATANPDVQLRTPVQLSVEKVYKGEHVPRTLLFTLPGGRENGLEIRTGLSTDLRPGTKVVVFLSEAPQGAGPWSRISKLYPQIYFVVDGETLHGPLKDVQRVDFERNLGEGAQP